MASRLAVGCFDCSESAGVGADVASVGSVDGGAGALAFCIALNCSMKPPSLAKGNAVLSFAASFLSALALAMDALIALACCMALNLAKKLPSFAKGIAGAAFVASGSEAWLSAILIKPELLSPVVIFDDGVRLTRWRFAHYVLCYYCHAW